MLEKVLADTIKIGSLTVKYASGETERYGEGPPHAVWAINDRSIIRRLIRNPWFELGQTYMEGAWDAPKGLAPLLEVFLRNIPEETPGSIVTTLKRQLEQANSVHRSKRHIAQHYDLDESLFRIFLDREMHYSCAYFQNPKSSLEDAQLAKCELILRKLSPPPGGRILDIGCGWGGLALYLAAHLDCQVTGLTLSREQHRVAQARARERGLSHRVEFRLEDYREHQGLYDRVVSVGMFEHVGVPYYEAFFTRMRDNLRPQGQALLHHIGRSGAPGLTNPWIRHYIFPGGYNPALSEVVPVIEKTGLKIADIEVLKFHYQYTLREWQKRFQARRAEVVRRWDESFARMWEFYLAACEVAFGIGDLVVFHIQIVRSLEGLPMTRDSWYRERKTEDGLAEQA